MKVMIQSELEEIINSRVQGVLASIEQCTQGLHEELSAEIEFLSNEDVC
jgi:hypothetical protein